MNHDIFISYRRDGGLVYARLLCYALKSIGYENVFFDYNVLENGYFDSVILEALNSCKDFIFILSPNSLERCYQDDDWVATEIRTALNLNKNIIMIAIDSPGYNWPVNLPTDLKQIFKLHQHVLNTSDYFEESVLKLGKRMKSSPSFNKLKFFTKYNNSNNYSLNNDQNTLLSSIKAGAISCDNSFVIVDDNNRYISHRLIYNNMIFLLNRIANVAEAKIIDIAVSESYWCILYYYHGYECKGFVPENFKRVVKNYMSRGLHFLSISISENEFSIVTKEEIHVSNTKIEKSVLIARERYGSVISINISNNSYVICCKNGVLTSGVDPNIETAIKTCQKEFLPQSVKFSNHGKYLITSSDSTKYSTNLFH